MSAKRRKHVEPEPAVAEAPEPAVADYVVAPGKSFLCLAGIKGAGDAVKASDFAGGAEFFANMIEVGYFIPSEE